MARPWLGTPGRCSAAAGATISGSSGASESLLFACDFLFAAAPSAAQKNQLSAADEHRSLIHPVTPGPEYLSAASGTLRLPAEPTRFHALEALRPSADRHGTDASGVPRPFVSQRLANPPPCGLVDTRKDGRHIIYSLRAWRPIRLITQALKKMRTMFSAEKRSTA